MKQTLAAFLLAFTLGLPAAYAADSIGFKETELPDPAGTRPLHVSIWYPTESTGPITYIGENPAFVGAPVIRDAAPETVKHPLVLLSHGYGGSWRNLNWLANALVQHGYVVAAPDHPGTTTFDKRPGEAAKLWERPHDLSRVLDALTASPDLAGPIDAERIAAIGHSLGGWTAASIGGARFSGAQLLADCKLNPNPRTCSLAEEFAIGTGRDTPLQADLRDARIKAVVTLDLGLARGFTTNSLAHYAVPALVISAGVDIGDLPEKMESGYLASHLPEETTHYHVIKDAMHFSFMQVCKQGAAEMIESETPGDGIVCKDGGTRSRQAIHDEASGMILEFLGEAIAVR